MTDDLKIIAHFMGYKVEGDIVKESPLTDDVAVGYVLGFLGYEVSYDSLIPVLEKCLITLSESDDTSRSNTYNYWNKEFMNVLFDIKKLREKIVEFIQWYNKPLKTN